MVLLWTSKLVAIWHRVPQKENAHASVDFGYFSTRRNVSVDLEKKNGLEVDVGLRD